MPSPDTIDLAVVGRAVLRRLPLLAMLAIVVGAATAGVLSTMAPRYLSEAQLEVRGIGAVEAGGRPDKEAVGTHVRGLTSTGMALALSAALHLTERAEFNSALPPEDLYGRFLRSLGFGGPKSGETDEDRLIEATKRNIRAYQVRDTRSIIVDCTTSTPRFSADCANTLADLYRRSLSGRSASESSDVRAKLGPQVERLTREVASADAQVVEFRGTANLFQGGQQATQLKEQQLGELTGELTRVATVRGDAEARANAARDMASRGIAAANPDVQKSTLIPRMEDQRVGLERQIAELSATLLAGHPRMKQLRAELANLQAQIRAEVQKVVDSLGNDARIAAAREDGIRRRVEDMKRALVSSAPDSARLAQLENDARAKRAELERLRAQYEKAGSTAGAGADTVEIEIVSPAYPSNEKVFPKIGSMAALAAFGSFLLGFAVVLTAELIRGARPPVGLASGTSTTGSTKGVAVPAARGGHPTHAAVRPTNADDRSALMAPLAAADAILAMAEGTPGFRLLVAGAQGDIDAAVEALALSRALAERGAATALLSWVGSSDRLARAAGIDASIGVAQLMQGVLSIEDVVQRAAGSPLDLVATGFDGSTSATASHPVDGSDAGRAAGTVLDAFDTAYDIVVVHAPFGVARDLFAAVQGRFDAGILVATGPLAASTSGNAVFLGFDVPDFPVIGVAQAASTVAAAPTPPKRSVRVSA